MVEVVFNKALYGERWKLNVIFDEEKVIWMEILVIPTKHLAPAAPWLNLRQ